MTSNKSPIWCSHSLCVFFLAFAVTRGARVGLEVTLTSSVDAKLSASQSHLLNGKPNPPAGATLGEPTGGRCRLGTSCKIGFCSEKDYCKKLAVGSPGCDQHTNSAAGPSDHCDGDSICINDKCREDRIPSGATESCQGHNEWCHSGKCEEDRCVSDLSSACQEHHECASNLCIRDKCTAESGKLGPYEECDWRGKDRNDFCASGNCDPKVHRCRGGKVGDRCGRYDHFCDSNICLFSECAASRLPENGGCPDGETDGGHSYCISGLCILGKCKSKKLGNGETCKRDDTCKSNICRPTGEDSTCQSKPADYGEYCENRDHCYIPHICEQPFWGQSRGQRPKEKERKICKMGGIGKYDTPDSRHLVPDHCEWCPSTTKCVTKSAASYGSKTYCVRI